MFKVASTRDLMTAAGEPCFPARAFDVLKENPDISWEWLPEDIPEITPALMAEYDGLHVNLPLVKASCVAGGDVRCKIIARNGVGYDTVDLEAMTKAGVVVTNTPIAVRRPVASGILALILAVAISILIYSMRDQARELVQYGYIGIFLISILANGTILFPVPGILFVFVLGAVFNPLGVAIAAGLLTLIHI